MNRTVLDRQLAELKEAVTDMGLKVDSAIVQSAGALQTADPSVARAVSCQADRIHQERLRIENMTALVITLQQPTLGDLRAALAAMNAAQDLEQVGNLAKGVSVLATQLPKVPASEATLRQKLSGLASAARGQVQAALGAYRRTSVPEALMVWARDDEVDHLYASFVNSCRNITREHPEQATINIPLLATALYLEEIADHAASICERVIYVATGEYHGQTAGAVTSAPEPRRPEPVSRATQPLGPARLDKPVKTAAFGGFWQQAAALQRFGTTLHGTARSLMHVLQPGGIWRDAPTGVEPRA